MRSGAMGVGVDYEDLSAVTAECKPWEISL